MDDYQQLNGGSQNSLPNSEHYTMPKVIDYLQREWFKFEIDKSHWVSEKSELLSRISQLESDKKLHEILRNDLCRRIKMLEYALHQERLKNNSSYKDQQQPIIDNQISETIKLPESTKENVTRNLIKRYLRTIGYNDVIVNKPPVFDSQSYQESEETDPKQITMLNMQQQQKQHIVNNTVTTSSSSPPTIDSNINLDYSLSELNKLENSNTSTTNNTDVLESLKQLDNINGSVSQSTPVIVEPNTTSESQLQNSTSSLEQQSSNGDDEPSYGSFNEDFFNKLSSKSKGRMKLKLGDMKGFYGGSGEGGDLNSSSSGGSLGSSNGGSSSSTSNNNSVGSNGSSSNGSLKSKLKLSSGSTKSSSGSGSQRKKLTGNLESMGLSDLNDITLDDNKNSDSAMSQRVWRYKNSLKSHFDGVRSIQFHPSSSLLLSASEDHSLKLWDLTQLQATKKSSTPELEPIYTFRGHLGPVFATAMTEDGKGFLSAGTDMIIRQWAMPPHDLDHYHQHGKVVNYLEKEFVGHSDGIWDLLTISQNPNQILSASSDGSIILWDSKSTNQLGQYLHPLGRDYIPTSITLPQTEGNRKLLAAYNDGSILLFDLETGEVIQRLCNNNNMDANGFIDTNKQINKLVSHPLLSLAISATEDHKIEFYDLNSSSPIVHSMVAHSSAISSLAIDPSGLYLASCSHDSSIRFWDISSKTCVQDLNSHRPKYDESINCIKYHPTKGYFASGGSDSIIRIHQ
ncbi:WD40 repeat-containing protein [Tieghemostelium lacteum]|uniref:WD40 repeat-containing protein n=1 Tax=Tieghemostelium lacteum TaxID=361077 RepID=A0A151Z4U8_TIELA|nr:WD40 repeat-containing protein [Tieghemostelium lacteum]|eukprot:KYQ88965.1 WD40 repeat-containing protein [Tieghemostelium lacteum]